MKNMRLIALITLLLAVTSIGIVGYSIIEGWGFSDSLYMTIITLSTTGFHEVRELSALGRYFTVLIIMLGVGTVAYAASTLISTLVSINLQDRGRKKMDRQIKQQKNHTIVLGFGRMGKSVCKELEESNEKFVVIEKESHLVEDLRKEAYLWIEGDAADDENLRKAGIENAKVLVSSLDNEADGLFVAVAAKNLNADVYVIIRADSESTRKKMLLAGADKVVLPYVMTGQKIAQSIINPDIEDFLELSGTKNDVENRLQLIDINITEVSPLIGKTLHDCGFSRDGLIIVGIRKEDKSFQFAPRADIQFKTGDCLIALGTRQSYEQTKEKLKI